MTEPVRGFEEAEFRERVVRAQARMEASHIDALLLTTEAVVPGALCAEVFAAMAEVISSSGFGMGNVGRMGQGLGMQLTETPSLTASGQTVLTEGMVMTLEPELEIGEGRGWCTRRAWSFGVRGLNS